MDENLVCECGNNEMWFFWGFARCTQCYNEYKLGKTYPDLIDNTEVEYLMRRWNKEENHYAINWERSQITYNKIK